MATRLIGGLARANAQRVEADADQPPSSYLGFRPKIISLHVGGHVGSAASSVTHAA
jgi:hypothetical protein